MDTDSADDSSPQRVRRRSKHRRGEIIAAATDLFASQGFAAVGIDDIGSSVGVTGPAVYRHFRSKQEVLFAALESSADALCTALMEALGSQTDPDARLAAVIRATSQFALDHLADLTIFLAYSHDPNATTGDAFGAARDGIATAWRNCVIPVFPGLTPLECDVRVEGVLALVEAVARRSDGVARDVFEVVAYHCTLSVLASEPWFDTDVTRSASTTHSSTWEIPGSKADAVMSVAMKLFRLNGFAGVSMDQIGEAAGITGPSVYRYYESKMAILVDAYDDTDARVALAAESAIRDAGHPRVAMDRLVQTYVTIALERSDVIVVTSRERRALAGDDWRRMSRRGRKNVDTWVNLLRSCRPELSDMAARLFVRAAFGLIIRTVQLPAPPSGPQLSRLALAVLLETPSPS